MEKIAKEIISFLQLGPFPKVKLIPCDNGECKKYCLLYNKHQPPITGKDTWHSRSVSFVMEASLQKGKQRVK